MAKPEQATVEPECVTCTRCGRTRQTKFMILRTLTDRRRGVKKVWRCRAKSVCASKGRRARRAAAVK